MLRLVHPAREGQEPTRPPKGRRSAALCITDDERRHLVQALKNLRLKFGTWKRVAEVVGIPEGSLRTAAGGKGRGSAALAKRIAIASGTTVEAVMSGSIAPVGTCPTCGHAADRRAS